MKTGTLEVDPTTLVSGVGIDKVKLTSGIGGYSYDPETQLLDTKTFKTRKVIGGDFGGVVKPSKTYTKYCANVDGVSFDCNEMQGLVLTFNPSKLVAPDNRLNYLSKGGNDLVKSKDKIMSVAKSVGLDFDLDSMSVNRLDLAKDTLLNKRVVDYFKVMQVMRCSRMNKREYENGYLFHNQNREYIFYNRGGRLGVGNIENLGRLETRFKTGDEVSKRMSLNRFTDLYELAPEQIDYEFKSNVQREYFKSQDEVKRQVELLGVVTLTDYEFELSVFNGLFQGRINDYLISKTMKHYYDEFGSLEHVKRLLIDSGKSVRTAQRQVNRFSKILDKVSNVSRCITQDGVGDTMKLYNELHTKFLQ